MAGSLSETLSGMKEEELVTNQKQELPLSPGEGASSVVASSPPVAAERKQRRIAGNPNPDAEIVALSPKTLLATNRLDNFISHRSSCAAVAEEVARHTIKSSPNSQAAASILSNASNPASISLGLSTGSFISPDGNLQQLPSLPALGASPPISFTGLLSGHTVGSQPMHPPNMTLYPFGEPKLWFTRVSGVEGFRSKTGPTNIVNLVYGGGGGGGREGVSSLQAMYNNFNAPDPDAEIVALSPKTLLATNSHPLTLSNDSFPVAGDSIKRDEVGVVPGHPKKRFLYTPTPSLGKKKVAPKKGKSGMVVFVVPAKRRSFAKRIKRVNLFLASAKDFFSRVELSTKKAMRERILLSMLLPCALAPPSQIVQPRPMPKND
ncbi:hypothetical protein AgCh_005292 [Apium graveolens]